MYCVLSCSIRVALKIISQLTRNRNENEEGLERLDADYRYRWRFFLHFSHYITFWCMMHLGEIYREIIKGDFNDRVSSDHSHGDGARCAAEALLLLCPSSFLLVSFISVWMVGLYDLVYCPSFGVISSCFPYADFFPVL